jgi:hypothetical protein
MHIALPKLQMLAISNQIAAFDNKKSDISMYVRPIPAIITKDKINAITFALGRIFDMNIGVPPIKCFCTTGRKPILFRQDRHLEMIFVKILQHRFEHDCL